MRYGTAQLTPRAAHTASQRARKGATSSSRFVLPDPFPHPYRSDKKFRVVFGIVLLLQYAL